MIDTSPLKDEQTLRILDDAIKKLVESGAQGPRAWRKLTNLAINHNPKIRRDIQYCIDEARNYRIHSQDEYNSNTTESMRLPLKFPQSLLMLIEALEPGLSNTTEGITKLYKAFPEFRAAEKI